MNKLQALRTRTKAAELSKRIERIYRSHVKDTTTMPESFWTAFEQLDIRFSEKMAKVEGDMEMSSICRATELEFIKLLKGT